MSHCRRIVALAFGRCAGGSLGPTCGSCSGSCALASIANIILCVFGMMVERAVSSSCKVVVSSFGVGWAVQIVSCGSVCERM